MRLWDVLMLFITTLFHLENNSLNAADLTFPLLSTSEWTRPCSLMDSSLNIIHTHTHAEGLQSAGAGHCPVGRFNIYGSLPRFTVSAWQKWSASQALCLSIKRLQTSHQLPSQSALQDVTERGPISRRHPVKDKSFRIQNRRSSLEGWMGNGNALNPNTAICWLDHWILSVYRCTDLH